MSIGAVTVFALAAAVLSIVLRQYKPEYSVLISLTAAVIIFISQIDKLEYAKIKLEELFAGLGSIGEFAPVILKGLGICIIVQIASDTCRDAGESSIASKLEMAGKLTILGLSLPLVFRVLESATELITKGTGI